MVFLKKFGIGSLLLVTAVYCFVYQSMKVNLSQTAAALAAQPVTIILDAGHGGEDGGTTSASGLRESQINLAISSRLEQLLALCGMEPTMIRQEDRSVSTEGDTVSQRKISDLKNRVKTVEQFPNAILVSIHQNHFSEEKYRGAQVFYAPTHQSKELAQFTQEMLRTALDPSNQRQIKPADTVYLMQKVQCPAILVECGFLSNPQEAALLDTVDYQKKLTCALAGAIAQYLEKGETEVEI